MAWLIVMYILSPSLSLSLSLCLIQAEAMLEKVIVIFRYLQDKDVFENFYKSHLSKRLLGGRSVSDEVRLVKTMYTMYVCMYGRRISKRRTNRIRLTIPVSVRA